MKPKMLNYNKIISNSYFLKHSFPNMILDFSLKIYPVTRIQTKIVLFNSTKLKSLSQRSNHKLKLWTLTRRNYLHYIKHSTQSLNTEKQLLFHTWSSFKTKKDKRNNLAPTIYFTLTRFFHLTCFLMLLTGNSMLS